MPRQIDLLRMEFPELVAEYEGRLAARYRELLEIEYDMIVHEMWWGVPVGPTMSMVYLKPLLGIGVLT